MYVGPVKTKKPSSGVYVGVRFDGPYGKTSGTVECPSRHGLFVRVRMVSPYVPPSGHELSNIGSSLDYNPLPDEGTREDIETFKLWNQLDQMGEEVALSTSKNSYRMNVEMYKQTSSDEEWMETGPRKSLSAESLYSRRSTIQQPYSLSEFLDTPVPETYKGPLLSEKCDVDFAMGLLQHFRAFPNDKIPKGYVARLMLDMEQLLISTVTSAIYYFDIPKKPDSQLIVVGDVHGQLNDVLWLFYKFGVPSADRTYLFNGDIADRGRYAVEIFLLLFAFKLACPTSILINRGNHESCEMNEVYGFTKEVWRKYGLIVYFKFQDIFNLLPLCSVIEHRVLVLHGGLCRQDAVTLDDINNIDRQRSCPISPETPEDQLMFDLLWSDPQAVPGRGPSGRGPECVTFGPDITEQFLKANKLDVCIRSHQVPKSLRGFEAVHDGRCVTLFSASNYCGTSGNLGAVIIFSPKLTFEVQEYMAPRLSEVLEVYNETKLATEKIKRVDRMLVVQKIESRARLRTRRSSVMNMERDISRTMQRIICERKADIWNVFWEKDLNKKGQLTVQAISDSMSDLLGRQLPWDFLIQKLSAVERGYVNYNKFLEQFRVEFRPKGAKHENWRLETVEQVFESIMKADLNLKETLAVFDRNCDGSVSYREFQELLSELKFGLSEPQIRLLMRIITAHHLQNDGVSDNGELRVDVAEFLGRFKVIYGHAIKDRSDEADPWVRDALAAIGRHILADKSDAAYRHYLNVHAGEDDMSDHLVHRRRSSAVRSAALFQKFRDFLGANEEMGDFEGFLSYDTFVDAIRQLPLAAIASEIGFKLDGDKLYRLAQVVDVTGSGKINYLEFLNAFHVVDKNATTHVAEQMWQQICASFFRQKVAIKSALSFLDSDGSGRVDREEFGNALIVLNNVLGQKEAPLTEEQINLVVTSIEGEADGRIDYVAFLDSFIVIDVVTGTGDCLSLEDIPMDMVDEVPPLVIFSPGILSSENEESDKDEHDSKSEPDNKSEHTKPDHTPTGTRVEEEATGLLLEYLRKRDHQRSTASGSAPSSTDL